MVCRGVENDRRNQIIYVCEAVENLIEPYMKENAELKELIEKMKMQEEVLLNRILTLQKTNGSLTDKVDTLETQNEKMKCCSNCKCDYLHDDECYGCRIGNSYIKWELAD